FLISPVCEDRLLIRGPAPVTATIIHRDNDIAVRGKQLALEVPRVPVLTIGTTVNAKQRRIPAAGQERVRLDDQAMNLGAILRRRAEPFGGRWLQRLDPLVVLV